jgi:hypothetical protein
MRIVVTWGLAPDLGSVYIGPTALHFCVAYCTDSKIKIKSNVFPYTIKYHLRLYRSLYHTVDTQS